MERRKGEGGREEGKMEVYLVALAVAQRSVRCCAGESEREGRRWGGGGTRVR